MKKKKRFPKERFTCLKTCTSFLELGHCDYTTAQLSIYIFQCIRYCGTYVISISRSEATSEISLTICKYFESTCRLIVNFTAKDEFELLLTCWQIDALIHPNKCLNFVVILSEYLLHLLLTSHRPLTQTFSLVELVTAGYCSSVYTPKRNIIERYIYD